MIDSLVIVGLGSIGSRHARIARSLLPKARITALRHRVCGDENPPNIDHCVTTIDAALAQRPQAAVIASPATHHLEAARALSAAGVHLLVEKPIAGSANGVLELIASSEERRVTLMTGYNLRFSPSLLEFRKALEAHIVGRAVSVRGEVGQALESWRPDTDYRKSVSANAALGGGALLELSHEIDYFRWLFGEVDWVSAVLCRQSQLQVDVEDTAHLTLGFAQAGGVNALIGTLNLDFVRHDSTRVCTVIGETGSLRWDGIAGSVSVLERGQTAWRTLFTHQPQRDETYDAEWRHFLECVETGRQPLVSGRDGLAVMEIVDAARRSSTARSVVSLNPSARER